MTYHRPLYIALSIITLVVRFFPCPLIRRRLHKRQLAPGSLDYNGGFLVWVLAENSYA
jgi:hypothetical protein